MADYTRIEKLRNLVAKDGILKGRNVEDAQTFYRQMTSAKNRDWLFDKIQQKEPTVKREWFDSILSDAGIIEPTSLEPEQPTTLAQEQSSAPVQGVLQAQSNEPVLEQTAIEQQVATQQQPAQQASLPNLPLLQDLIAPIERKTVVADATRVQGVDQPKEATPVKDFSSMSNEELQSEIAPLQEKYAQAKQDLDIYKGEIKSDYEKKKEDFGKTYHQSVQSFAISPMDMVTSENTKEEDLDKVYDYDRYAREVGDDVYKEKKNKFDDASLEYLESPAYKEFASRQVKDLEKKKLELEEQEKKLDSDYYNFSRQKKDYGKRDLFLKELDTKRDIIKAQLDFTNKTIQALQAPTKEDNSWWLANVYRGAKDNATAMLGTIGDVFTGFRDIKNNLTVADALQKVASLGEKATPEAIDKALTKEEKDMLIQWEQMNETKQLVSPNLSVGYQVGEGVAVSTGFMLDFFLTRGATKAVSAPAKKAVMNAFGKWLTSNTVKGSKVASNVIRGTGKTAAWTTDATISTAVRTPLMSSTYENITKRMTEFDENGKPRSAMDAIILGTTDSLIENFSETSGIMINKLGNAIVYKPLIKKPFYALLGKMGASGKGVKAFGKEIKEFTNILKKGGYDGYTEEMLEEVFGAILTEARGLTGIDPNDKQAWEEFWKPENLMITAQSIAIPMVPGMVKGTVRGVNEYKNALPVGEGNASASSAESTTQLPNSNLQAPMPVTYDFGDGNVVQGRLIGDYTIEDGKLQGNPIFQHEENGVIVTTKLIDKYFDKVSFEQTPQEQAQEQAQEQQDVSTNQDGTLTVGEEITDDDIDAFIDALEADAKEEGIEDVRRSVKAKFTNSDGVTNEGELMGSYSIIDGNIVGHPVFRYTNASGTTVVRPLSQADLEKLEVESLQKQEPIAPQEQAVEQTESQAEGQTQGQTTKQPQEVEQEVVVQENTPIQEEQGQAESQTEGQAESQTETPIETTDTNPMFETIKEAEELGFSFDEIIQEQEKELNKLRTAYMKNPTKENAGKVREQTTRVNDFKSAYAEYQAMNQAPEQAQVEIPMIDNEPVVISNDDTNTEEQPAVATTDQQTEQVTQEEPTAPVVEEQNKEAEQISEEVKRIRATNAVMSALKKAGINVHRATQEMMGAVLDKGDVGFLRTSDGTIYGWVEDGEIYMTEDGMNPNVLVYEYTHLWAQAVQREYSKKWQQIKDTLKECTELWDEVVNDSAYESIKDNEDAIASELLSRYSGKNGEQRLMNAVSDLKTSSAKSIIEKVKSAIRALWESVQRLYGIDTKEFYKSNFDDINKIADSVLRDLINGKNPLLVENPNKAELRIQQSPMQSAIEDTGIAHLDNVESFENTHLPTFASIRNYTKQEAIAMVNTISEKIETLENYISGTLSQYSNLESVAQTIKTINERIKALQESLSFAIKQKGITMSDLSTIASEPNTEYTKTTQQEEPIQEDVKEELVQEVEQTQIEEGEPSTDKVTLGLRLGRFEAAKEDDLQGMPFDKIVRTSNSTFRARFVGTNDNGNDVYQVYNPNTGNKQYRFKYIDNAASVEDLSTGYVNVDNKGKIHKKATEDTNSVRVYFTDNKESEERVFVYFADSVKSSSTSYTSIYNEEGEPIKKEKEVQNIWDKTKEEIKKYIKEKVEKSIYSRIEQGFNISNPTYLTAKETLLETQKLYAFSQRLLLQDKDFATTGASQQKAAAFSQTMTELLAEAKKDAASKGIKVAKVIAESAQKELEEMDTPQFLVTEEDIIEGTHEQRKSIRTWLNTIGIKVHMLSQEEFEEKVNSFLDKPEFHITRSQKGDVYGFVYRGQVYINKSIAGSEVYVHEYSHIWLQSLKKLNPQLFERGVELAKLMPEYEELLGNAIANLPSDSKITQEQLELWTAEEMLAHYMGKRGAERINALAEQGDSAIGLAKRIKAWIKEAYNYIKSVMDSFSDKEIAKMREEDFADMMLNDLANLVEIKSASVKEEIKSMEAYRKSIENLKREFLMYIGGVENGGLNTSYIVARNQLRFIIKKISKLYPRGAKITRKQCEDIYRQLLESNKTNFKQGNIKAETYTRPLVKAFNNLETIFNVIASDQIEVLQAKVDKTFNRSISGTRKQDIKRGGVMSYTYANAVMSLREQSEEELLDGTNTTLTNNKRAELNDKFDKLAEEIKDLQEQLNNANVESKAEIELKIREKQTSYNMLAVEDLAITAQEERRKVAEAEAQMSEHIKRIDNLREQIKQDQHSRSTIQSEVVVNAQQEASNKYSINILNKRIKEANEEIRYTEYLMSVTSQEILEHNNKQLVACNAILEAGRSEYHAMVYKRVQEKAEFLAGAISDVQVESDKQVSKVRDKINNLVQKTLGSLDYLIDRISVNSTRGNSFLRKHFLDDYNKRNSEYIKQMQEHMNMLDAKISETFDGVAGDKIKKVKNINDLSYLLNEVLFGKKIEYDVPRADEEEPEHVVLELNMSQAMEIYLQARQEDGRRALNKGGITDDIIDEIVSRFDEPSMVAYKEWADYMQLELLPSLKERFNKRYREQFFIDIPLVENYFPIKAKLSTTEDLLKSLSGSEYRFNASTVANNLYARSHNSAIELRDVDINPANVLAQYLCNMEHWYHMSELQEKTNWLVNSGKFQRLLKQQGESTRKHFNQSLIYTVSNTDSHSVIGNIVSMYQLGMVGFRGMTAIKQLASIPAFFIYATNKYVATEMALNASPHRLFGRVERAKELFPTIKERIESGSLGSELLLDFEDSGNLKWRKIKRGASRTALWANRRIDIYVVANGTLAVYDGMVKQKLSEGRSQAEAEAIAYAYAMNAFEATQQSSNRAYLAPFQQNRNWSLITGFQNASYAYARRFVEMSRFLKDWTSGAYKEQIENTIKYYVEFEGFSRERATELANKDYKRSMISSWNTLAGLGLSSYLFKYGITGFVQWLFGYDGDDDEDNEKRRLSIYTEHILNVTGGVLLEGLAYGNIIIDLINQTIKGEKIRKVDFIGLLKPLGEGLTGFAEGVQMFSDEDKENSDAWFKIIQSIALASPAPLDAPTATKVIAGIKDMFTNTPNKDEFWIGFLNFMNLPTSQMANILQAVEGYDSNKDASEDPRYINAYNWASRLWEYIE